MLKNLRSKKGKRFDAYIKLKKEANGEYKLEFEFAHNPDVPSLKDKKKDIFVKCPDCGGHMVRGNYAWECENQCGMEVPYIKNGREIEESIAEALLMHGSTDYLTGFVSQKGKPLVAAMKREGKKITLVFPEWKK